MVLTANYRFITSRPESIQDVGKKDERQAAKEEEEVTSNSLTLKLPQFKPPKLKKCTKHRDLIMVITAWKILQLVHNIMLFHNTKWSSWQMSTIKIHSPPPKGKIQQKMSIACSFLIYGPETQEWRTKLDQVSINMHKAQSKKNKIASRERMPFWP